MMLGAIAAAVAVLAASPIQGSVFGPVVSVKGTTFTITTSLSPDGKSVVSAASAKITEQAAAPRSSLKVGACVMATGARNSKGVVAATRITLSAPVKGTCGGGFTFRRPGAGGTTRPPRVGGAPPAGGFRRTGGFGFAFGLVTKASGSTLTVKGSFGKTARTTTVTVSSKTSLEHTITVKPSDLKVKDCAFVRGVSPDKGKTVKATDVALTPETNGSCTNGFRRPGS
jgi:Domain of unknown function (DUF5666)